MPQGQLQGQAELQGQLQGQAELQGQAQGQGQGQASSQGQSQGQGQSQYAGQVAGQSAVQDLQSSSWNGNANGNLNGNGNGNANGNGNLNGNANGNANGNLNANENTVDNDLDNKVDNEVENKVENDVETRVDTDVDTDIDVDITVDLDLSTLPDDADVIDVEEMGIECIEDSVAQVDAVAQSATGNNFNLDQINNMADNDFLGIANVSFNGGGAGGGLVGDIGLGNDDLGGGFIQSAAATGGTSSANNADARVGDDGSNEGVGTATADGIVNQEAFTQNIVMGANLQYNASDIVGGNSNIYDDSDAV